jgi:hypothetical protein
MTIRPLYARSVESAPQSRVQARTHRDLMQISPAMITEAFNVYHENGPVDCWLRHGLTCVTVTTLIEQSD